jgi:hypothetical protein
MGGLVGRTRGQMQQAEDPTIAGTTDCPVREAVSRWKLEDAPAFWEALFQPDPITTSVDTRVPCNGMELHRLDGRRLRFRSSASSRVEPDEPMLG